MNWTQVLAILGSILLMFGSTVTMFLWARSEAREDRRENYEVLRAIQSQVNGIQEEMKDFHGRLCTIEEARRK